jgi:SagB-type dehydrogenase family enzyme
MKTAGFFLVWLCFELTGMPIAAEALETGQKRMEKMSPSPVVSLPRPRITGGMPLVESMVQRRSERRFTDHAIPLEAVSQLLWAAQGETERPGRRTAPSAGALYPLEVYLVAGRVATLAPGIYRYAPNGHLLNLISGDHRSALAGAALGQSVVKHAGAVFVFTAFYSRTTGKYGKRGIRYVHMEAGHAAQNLCLQATALGLGIVPIGAFDDTAVGRLLGLPREETVLYLLPVGITP